MGAQQWAFGPWALLLLLQLVGASHVVHRSLEAEAAPASVPASIVSPLLRTGYHFQPAMNWINVLPGDTFMVYHAHNGVQHSVELNVPARDTAVPFAYNGEHTADVHLASYDMQRTAGLSNMKRTMVVVSLPERAEAEALVRDGEHAGLVDYWWHTQAAAAAVPLFFAREPAHHLSSNGRTCFNYSRIFDATRGCSPPSAFAVAAGGRDHIVTSLFVLNSGSLFDWIVQLGIGSLFLIIRVVALDDQRKKNGWGRVAKAFLILLLVIPALPNTAMAARQFQGGDHDQAAAGPVDAAPGLMPQSKVAADHSACTYDQNTPDPHRCVHHKNITT